MFDRLYRTIKDNESKGDFSYANVTDSMLIDAESKLSVSIPSAYKWFLLTFGHGGIDGVDTLGIGKNGRMVFVDETLKFRSYGLPHEFIMIDNCDEWIYCINSTNGKIGMWSQGDKECRIAYDNFEMYLSDRIADILENR